MLLVGIVAVAIGAGTWAQFTSNTAVDNNEIAAGTFNLVNDTGTFTFSNIYPGWENSTTITIENTGSLPGYFNLTIENAAGNQEMLDHLQVSADGGTTWYYVKDSPQLITGQHIGAGATVDVTLMFKLDIETGNAAQGGIVTFDVKVYGAQDVDNDSSTLE